MSQFLTTATFTLYSAADAPPEAEHAEVRAEAERRLAAAAHPAGGITVHQQVRYTLGIRPPGTS